MHLDSKKKCSHGCHDHNHETCDHNHEDHTHAHDHCPKPREGKRGILLTAFGCALTHTHHLYDQFEDEVRQKFPDINIKWAFTANRIRAKLRSRNIPCLSVAEALSQMIDEGYSHVAIQSLHTLPGVEYDWVVQQAQAMCHPRKGLTKISIGAPLLNVMEDLEQVVQAIDNYLPSERTENDGIILVGHGTYHKGHTSYMALEGLLSRTLPNIVVGTLMDKTSPAHFAEYFLSKEIKRVFLVPFMCVPGHHVEVDLFGNHEHSWENILSTANIEVVTVRTCSLDHTDFRHIWHNHLAEAVKELQM